MGRFTGVILAIIFLAGTGAANARPNVTNVPCVIVENSAPQFLAEKHGESAVFVGGTNTEQGPFQVGLYFDPEDGGFTLFLINPKGGHCVLMVGDGALMDYVKPDQGS